MGEQVERHGARFNAAGLSSGNLARNAIEPRRQPRTDYTLEKNVYSLKKREKTLVFRRSDVKLLEKSKKSANALII